MFRTTLDIIYATSQQFFMVSKLGTLQGNIKSYARDAHVSHYINIVEHVHKLSKVEKVKITFTEEEAHLVLQLNNDALVVSLRVEKN